MRITNYNKLIKDIADLIAEGIQAWTIAGEHLVEILDNSNKTIFEVANSLDMDPNILARFEQLGRRQLVPQLLMDNYPASKHIQKLTFSMQEELVGGSVEVLAADNNDKLLIATKNLTPQQCKQVFTKNGVRDLAAQRAFIESNRRQKKDVVVVSENPYRINKKEVIFERGCKLKASQLINILAQIQ